MTSTERDPAWSERLNPRNWSLAAKLVAVGLVPTVLALVLGVLRISDQAGVAAQLGEDNRLLDIRAGVSETSQLLQAERNAAVLFVAGGRQGDRGALDQAVAASDASLDRVRSAIAAPDLLDASSTTALQNAEGGFTQLPVLRSEAGNSLVSTDDVRSRYTSIIERAGVLERALIRQAATADGAGLGDALTATSEAREALALQHTTLAGAIVAGELREPDRIVVTGTDAAFTSAFADYQVALTPDQLGDYGNFATDAANVERERLKTAIMATPAGRPVTADLAAWDTAYANSVAVVDRAAQGVGGELDATSIAAQENAGNQAGVNSVILMLGVLLGIAIIVLLARSLIRSLRILRRSALDVAERKLPAAVESMRSGQPLNAMVEPVPLTGRDEVGQVARAFDAVHGQAIRLAADQAALQSNVSNMFVNLSRRSQALVERQLQLIEQLESNEQDPDQLSNLFQLDHLATRMRRNSENLLVLAGTDLTKRNVAPVPVVDVLRAAVSEIEQYQRVVVQPPPVATVAGRAASDLVHLLAELLDNATNFSPPDSQVVMSTTRANDGSLFVEIADRGVGMADHELSEANQRLSQPAAVDVSASRRMGLFVVGRLANRHGLGVRLGGGVSGGTGGGLTASVAVPANLVPTAEPVDRRPARAGATAGVAPAAAFGGAPALPASAPSAPSGSPSLPEQRPSTGNGRSLSSLVAGDDGPMSPAPAFGAGRPPTPPVNGNGAPGRRPAPVPPEEGDEAAQAPRPAGPERGPWPVESLRRPPTGDPAPPTNGTPTAVPSAFTGPAELPKRTPRGVNGTPRGAETAESAGTAESVKSEGPAPTGRAAGLAAGAAGLAGASALRRGMDEGARTPETSDTADATADPETAAAAEFDSGEGEHTTRFPSELPRREATTGGARGGEGASALDEGTSPRETGGLPTRRPGSPADAGSATGSTTGATAFGTGAAGTGASETADATEDSTPPVGAPAAAAESTGAQARPGRPRSAEPSEKDTDGAEAGTDPSTVDSADTDSGRAHDLLEGGRDSSGSDSSESTDSALDSARPGPDTDSTRAGDSTRATGAGALGAAALGAAALGGAALGRGERTDSTDTERADTERPGSERVDSERPAAEQPAAERSDTERPAAEQPGTGFPQRRPLSPGRPADRRPALGSPGGLLPGRGAGEPSPGRLSGPPAPRENPPIGPAGLPQRTPRRPRQAPTGGTDGLFAASTPGDTQTTGQLRRPGGFESRRPSRATDPVPGTAAEAFDTGTGTGSTDTGATTSTPSSTAPGPARNGAGSRGDESRGGDDRTDTTTGSTGSDSAAGARAESTGAEHAVDRRPGTDRPEPAQGESGRPETGRPDTSRPDPSRPETGAAGLPLRTPGANRGVRPYGTSPTGESAPTGRSSTAPGPGDTGPTGTERNGQPASAPNGTGPNGTGPNGTGPNGTGPNGTGQNGQGGPVRLGEGPRPTDDGRRRPTPFSAPAPFAGGAFGGPAGRPPQAPRPNGPTPYGPTPNGNGHGGNGAAGRPGPAGPPQRPARPQPPADDAGLPGSTGAGPAPSRPSGFDLGQTTPIFEEIASAWFRSNGDVPVRWAEDGSAAPEEPAQPPVFATAADEGWRVADATAQATAAESDKQAETTDAGLPKRRPRARLVPGNAAGSAVLAPPSGPARNAEAIRGRLASYQQGVRQGRESRLRSRSAPGPNEQQNEENR